MNFLKLRAAISLMKKGERTEVKDGWFFSSNYTGNGDYIRDAVFDEVLFQMKRLYSDKAIYDEMKSLIEEWYITTRNVPERSIYESRYIYCIDFHLYENK